MTQIYGSLEVLNICTRLKGSSGIPAQVLSSEDMSPPTDLSIWRETSPPKHPGHMRVEQAGQGLGDRDDYPM